MNVVVSKLLHLKSAMQPEGKKMASVTYSRKASRDYQSKGTEITLDVYDNLLSVAETLELARAIVNTSLGQKVKDRRRANELARRYFEDENVYIEDFAE